MFYRFGDSGRKLQGGAGTLTKQFPKSAASMVPAASGGIWYSPATPGQGLVLQRLAAYGDRVERLVGAWATFDPPGAADDSASQHWLTLDGQGDTADTFSLRIYRTIGGGLGEHATNNRVEVGHARAVFQGCDQLHLSYEFDQSGAAAEIGGLVGSLTLQRFDACLDWPVGSRWIRWDAATD